MTPASQTTTAGSLQANSWLIYSSRLAAVGLTFATVFVIARSAGPAGTGEYVVALATSGVLVQLGNVGLSSATLYFVSRRPRRAGSMMTLAGAWSLVAAALALIAAPLSTRLGLSPAAVHLISLWVGLQMALLLTDQILLALRMFFQSGTIQVARRVTALVLTVVFVLAGVGRLPELILAAVLGDGLALAASAVVLRRRGVRVDGLRRRALSRVFRLAFRAFPVLVLPFLLFRSDVLLLTAFRGARETGVYAVAAQIVDGVLLLPSAFGMVLFVALSDGQRARLQVLGGVRRILLYVTSISIVLVGFGSLAIPVLFGRAFAPAYPMLLLLLPGAIAIAWETQVAQYFSRQGYPWFLSRAWLGGLILNVALNLILIPLWGGLGAALTSTLAYLVVSAVIVGRYFRETRTGIGDILAGASAERPRAGVLVLSLFPLTRSSLSAWPDLSDADRLPLSSLPLKDFGRVWRLLRAPRREAAFVFLTSDDKWQRALADGVMILVNAGKKVYVYADSGEADRFHAGKAFAGVFSLAVGTIRGIVAASMNAVGSASLDFRPSRRVSRRRFEIGGSRGIAYLRSSAPMPAIGGSVGHSQGVIAALQTRGMQVTVCACAPPCPLADGVRFRRLEPSRFLSPIQELNWHSQARRYFRQAVGCLGSAELGFLYQRYVINDLSGVRLARRFRVPLVLEFNGPEVWVARNWSQRRLLFGRLAARIEDSCLRNADLVVVVSKALESEVLERGVSPRRVLVYPNAVDPDVFDPDRFGPAEIHRTRQALHVPPDAILLTHLGTFGPWHGAEVFARAIPELPNAVGGRRLHFLFVGDGDRAAVTRSLLAREIGAGRVTMAGSRSHSETPGVLAASDVLVSPHVPNPDGSAFFGSPTKLFEYMAMAKIIVASDLDQIGEVLRGWTPGGEASPAEPCGILVPPGDPHVLAMALLRAAAISETEAACLGRRARDQVLRAFTWKRHVAAIIDRLECLGREEGIAAT